MKITLALGGGGSKGNAHIGVLRVLEREGYQIAAVAGTSIGGLIGAAYLAGNSPDAIEERLAKTEFRHLFRRRREERDSLLGLAGVAELLADVLADHTFEDLSVPLALTAVDLITGQEVILRKGSLLEAVLATIAFPGIFPSRRWGDYQLVDGGLINPVPVNLARSLAPGLPVVAVALSGATDPHKEVPQTRFLGPLPAIERMTRFRIAQAFNVFARSVTISSRLLTELRLDAEKPDLVIRPDVDHIGLLDTVDVHEVVLLGEKAAEEQLPRLARPSWTSRLVARLNTLNLFRRPESDES